MTQKKSSLKNWLDWLEDFLRRCFARSYKVRCLNKPDSPVEHDFRRCWKCHSFIHFLDFKSEVQQCPQCGVLTTGFTDYDGSAVYCDTKNREFRIKEPLYPPFVSWGIMVTVFWWALMFVVFKHPDFVPETSGFEFQHLFMFLSTLVVPNLLFIFLYIKSNNLRISRSSATSMFSVVVFWGIFWMLNIIANDSYWTFRWSDVPTKEQWEIQQNEKVIAQFEQLSGDEKLLFALEQKHRQSESQEWDNRVSESFGQLLQNDFSKAMEIRSKYPSIFVYNADLYRMYGQYLKRQSEGDRHELVRQCEQDPWNLASGLVVVKYKEIFEPCDTLTREDNADLYRMYGQYLKRQSEGDRHELVRQCEQDPWNLASGLVVVKYKEIFEPCDTLTREDFGKPYSKSPLW